ncbi:hypothetical protein Tco_1097071 [Tanacetum coccineum]
MFGSSLSDHPLSIVPLVWSVAVSCDESGKGGSRVLAPDLVVIAKVGAFGSKGIAMLAISFFPITFAESMAVILLKEAQGPWMAEMKALKSLTEETQEKRAEA